MSALDNVHYVSDTKWLFPQNRVLFKGIGGDFGHIPALVFSSLLWFLIDLVMCYTCYFSLIHLCI